MTTKVVKLITGEELLADVTDNSDGSLVLTNPMLIMPRNDGLGMVPWPLLVNYESTYSVTIYERGIICLYEPRAEVVNAYKQQTGGIITAPAGALDMLGK